MQFSYIGILKKIHEQHLSKCYLLLSKEWPQFSAQLLLLFFLFPAATSKKVQLIRAAIMCRCLHFTTASKVFD